MSKASGSMMENCVKYMLFPSAGDGNSNNVSKETLETISVDYISHLQPVISSYIWQCDPFNLYAVESKDGLHLEGVTCFDDNIEDEWFIVFLLLQLTKEDPNLVVKVEDSDGEFLLIEAADHIPKWLDPETSENRVFLYRGSLHIIPIAKNPGHITPIPSGVPSISDAVTAVRQFSSVTQASAAVQQDILRRIDGYPQKICEFQHRAHCYVPAGVATILKEEPQILSAAVKAFYHRTPLEHKACLAMLYFPPETRVMTNVLFSHCLYAQLINQKYVPEKRIGWNLPPVNHPDFKSHDLGMKLACGFEILASSAPKSSDFEQEDVNTCDFRHDLKWSKFFKSLVEKGYFKGEVEGSRLYTQLLQQAKNFYVQTLSKNTVSEKQCPGVVVKKLLGTLNINYEELKMAENNLPIPDDDNWMVIGPDDLEDILSRKSGSESLGREKNIIQTVTGTLNSFLHHASGVDGVEFPTNASKKQKVALDSDAFADAFKNILDFKVPNSDDDASSSSMSSYSDDDSSDVELGETGASGLKRVNSENCDILTSMKSYMEQMDEELAATEVGKSFEKVKPLSSDLPGASGKNQNLNESVDIDDESDEFCPVDIDMTAVKNILDSYASQQGLPGPASNLFASMGIELPENSET